MRFCQGSTSGLASWTNSSQSWMPSSAGGATVLMRGALPMMSNSVGAVDGLWCTPRPTWPGGVMVLRTLLDGHEVSQVARLLDRVGLQFGDLGRFGGRLGLRGRFGG